MANVTFYIGDTAPGTSGLTTGGLYINKMAGGIYYATATNVRTKVASKVAVSASFGSGTKVCDITVDGTAHPVYFQRCATKTFQIASRIPQEYQDYKDVSKTLTETDLGGTFVGYEVDGWAGLTATGFAFSRLGVTVGATSSGGTPSYKIGARVERVSTVSYSGLSDDAVKFTVYYIPF